MAKQSKTLQLMALKLCVDEEEKVISKAAEFERLLQMKSTTNNITDIAKVVICLDLAASIYGVDFDQKIAIKCSGMKCPTYMNSRKIIENVLELNNDQLSISSLCLTLQCNVQDLAERILEEYKKSIKMELDMSLPQYVCMAVYHACRISKIKVPKSKLIDKSQLKSSQWSKLDAEWTKFVDQKFAAVVKKKRGRAAKNAVIDEEEIMEVDEEIIVNKKEEPSGPQIEEYEDWKRRILQKAYKDLEKLNKHNQIKPKNSPSKQKDTPSKQNTRSKQKDTPNKEKYMLNDEKDSPNKQNDHSYKQKKSPSKQKDYPNKQKDILNKQNDHPVEQKDSINKQKDHPNKQKDHPNKQKDSLNKQNDHPVKQKDSLNKQTDHPDKQKDYQNKQKDHPNKQKDALDEQKENTINDYDRTFSPRRSPRKTPLKYEPYKSPVKSKGVRLLFPV